MQKIANWQNQPKVGLGCCVNCWPR